MFSRLGNEFEGCRSASQIVVRLDGRQVVHLLARLVIASSVRDHSCHSQTRKVRLRAVLTVRSFFLSSSSSVTQALRNSSISLRRTWSSPLPTTRGSRVVR
jgi:hypothetical protein